MGNLIDSVMDRIMGRGDINESLKKNNLVKSERGEQPEKLADQTTDLLNDEGHPVGSEGIMDIHELNIYHQPHHSRPMVYFCGSRISDIHVARAGRWSPRLDTLRRNVFVDPRLIEMLYGQSTLDQPKTDPRIAYRVQAVMSMLSVKFKVYRDGIGLYMLDGITKAEAAMSKVTGAFYGQNEVVFMSANGVQMQPAYNIAAMEADQYNREMAQRRAMYLELGVDSPSRSAYWVSSDQAGAFTRIG